MRLGVEALLINNKYYLVLHKHFIAKEKDKQQHTYQNQQEVAIQKRKGIYLYNYFVLGKMQESSPACYECNTRENLRICSQYTAVCQKCYDVQVQQAKYFKSLRKKDPQIDQIAPSIFLGNEDAACSEEILKQRGITAICACGTNLQTPFTVNPTYAYKMYEVDDFPKAAIKPHFEDHFNWMKEMLKQNRKVLIHCAAGISRSASFTIAYFMRQKGTGFQANLEFVRSKRKCIFPNSGFRLQLQQYEQELIEKKIINFE